jgi:hypothetical protein
MLRRTVVALAVVGLTACGDDGGGGDSGGGLDLDEEAGLFAAERVDTKFVLYTWPNDDSVLVDVKAELDGGTEGQYDGTRSGDAEAGYELDLDCLNVGSSPVCDEWGTALHQSCVGHDDGTLQCDDFFFRPISSDDLQ